MRTTGLANRIIAFVITVLMVFGAAFCGAEITSYAADVSFPTFTGTSPYSNTGYSTYYHNKNMFNGNVILNGVDVSAYQSGEKSNYKTAKKNGVDFAIIRTTFTYTGSGKMDVDSQWINHYDKARDAGMMLGLYCFSQATSVKEAQAEANKICDEFEKHIKKKYGSGVNCRAYLDMPIYMDYETSSGYRINELKKADATKYADAFCQTIASRGYTPGIYASTSFLNNRIDGKSLGKKYEIWVAQYWKASEYVGSAYNHWQYSSSAKISGLYNDQGNKASIDVNFWYLDKNRTSSASDDVAGCSIKIPEQVVYAGSPVMPDVTVVNKSGSTLEKGTDYTVGYACNNKLGTGYAYIRGIGAYTGYKLVAFQLVRVVNIGLDRLIEAGNVSEDIVDEPEIIDPEIIDPEITDPEIVNPGDDEETIETNPSEEQQARLAERTALREANPCFPLVSSDMAKSIGYTVTSQKISGVVPGTAVGGLKKSFYVYGKDYSIEIIDQTTDEPAADSQAVATGDLLAVYDGKERIATACIYVNGKATFSFNAASYSYDGGVKTPKVTVKLGGLTVISNVAKNSNNELVALAYPSGRKNPGTYSVTLSGKGELAGTFKGSFAINVKGAKLKSVKSAGKKKFKAKWTKLAKKNVSGYQIQYSRYSDMSYDLIKTASSYKTASKTCKTNFRKQMYYVRIRTYKKIGSKKYYSAWSAKKTVKVK